VLPLGVPGGGAAAGFALGPSSALQAGLAWGCVSEKRYTCTVPYRVWGIGRYSERFGIGPSPSSRPATRERGTSSPRSMRASTS
jgi:hypothetical protein